MPATTKSLPAGRARYEQTLVQSGMSPEVAYTLAEDVSAMAGANFHKELAEQNRAIDALNDKIDACMRLVEERGEEIKSVETRQQGAMNSLEGRMVDAMNSLDARQERAMNSLEGRVVDAINSLDARQEKAMNSLEGRVVDAINSLDARQEKAMNSLEGRMVDAMNSLEARHDKRMKSMETRSASQYDRLVSHQVKLLWTIVGSVALTAVALVGKWAMSALGF